MMSPIRTGIYPDYYHNRLADFDSPSVFRGGDEIVNGVPCQA